MAISLHKASGLRQPYTYIPICTCCCGLAFAVTLHYIKVCNIYSLCLQYIEVVELLAEIIRCRVEYLPLEISVSRSPSPFLPLPLSLPHPSSLSLSPSPSLLPSPFPIPSPLSLLPSLPHHPCIYPLVNDSFFSSSFTCSHCHLFHIHFPHPLLLPSILHSSHPPFHSFTPPIAQSLANKHPDIQANHFIAVLAMRGDLSKATAAKVNSPPSWL